MGGVFAEDVFVVDGFEFAGAWPFDPEVLSGELVSFLDGFDGDDAGVCEVDGGLFFFENGFTAAECLVDGG